MQAEIQIKFKCLPSLKLHFVFQKYRLLQPKKAYAINMLTQAFCYNGKVFQKNQIQVPTNSQVLVSSEFMKDLKMEATNQSLF